MIHSFPYSWAEPLELSGLNLMGGFEPAGTDSLEKGPTIDEALASPIGTPP